jgi:hypothetical protein
MALFEQRGRDLVALGVFLDHFWYRESIFHGFFAKEGFADPNWALSRLKIRVVVDQFLEPFARRRHQPLIEGLFGLVAKELSSEGARAAGPSV